MPTIIERGSSGDSAASGMLVAVIAIVLLVGLALFMFNVMPFQNNASGGTPRTIDVNVDTPVPGGANQ